MATQDILKKSQTIKKKKKIAKMIFLGLGFSLLLDVVNYLFFSPKLSINTITVTGNHWIDSQDILASANKVLAGRYFYLYPQKSILLYPKALLAKQIQSDWPIISQIAINTSGFDSIVISIEERPDDTVWCRNDGDKKTCWFTDPTGYIFAPAPIFSPDVFLELNGLLSAVPIGTQPLPEVKYQAITQFMGGLKEALNYTPLVGSVVSLANLEGPNSYEVILNRNQAALGSPKLQAEAASTTIAEWKLILNTTLLPTKQLNNLITILSSGQFQKDFNANNGRLDYVDLRFDQKVFYKFK